jgi:proline iminopeptidase
MLSDANPALRDQAASEWCAWEDAHVSLTPGHVPNPRFQDPEFRLRFARLVTHYWRHAAFLEEDQLIRDAPKLNGIPGALIHGRYDVSSPLVTAGSCRNGGRPVDYTFSMMLDTAAAMNSCPWCLVP